MSVNLIDKLIQSTAFQKSKAVLLNVCSVVFHYIHKKLFFGVFSFIDEKFFKFLFVGALNTLFSYVIYAMFVTFGLSANVSLFIQYILGVLWNFKTTGVIVFKNHDNKLIFKFVGCYVVTFILNSILLKSLIQVINPYFAQGLLVLPVAIVSFLLLKFFVFK